MRRCALLSILTWATALGACSPKHAGPQEPLSCNATSDCPTGHECYVFTCRTPAEMEAIEREIVQQEELRRQQERDKEFELLKASGVRPDLKVEQASEDGAAPQAQAPPCRDAGCVRVVQTEGDSPIFAACRADERLIGGGCKPVGVSISVAASYPSQQTADDTRGARWNCVGFSEYVKKPIEAFALCQRLAP